MRPHLHHDHHRRWRRWHWQQGRGLQRTLFWSFGGAILFAGCTAWFVGHVAGDSANWEQELGRIRTFLSARFAETWDDPQRRDAFAAAFAQDLDLDLVLVDPAGKQVGAWGEVCTDTQASFAVKRGEEVLGRARVCFTRHGGGAKRGAAMAAAVLFVMWLVSGRLARRIVRPIRNLVTVARELGAGKLHARADLHCGGPGEMGVLAEAFNDMAARIERQLVDQRELLAGVSHELRTPLARIRLIVELMRDAGADEKKLGELEREAIEMDGLVGELLASARLDFAEIVRKPLDGREIATRALERAGEDPGRLVVDGDAKIDADPTLLSRALLNLVDNAKKHGTGLDTLRVRRVNGVVRFEAEDKGAGFAADTAGSAFVPFAPRPDGQPRPAGSLGLGLTLVKRIAEAHGGRAFAENRAEGGARVGIELPASASPSTVA